MILKTEQELQNVFPKTLVFLKQASRLNFWHKHFKNHNFIFDAKNFDWEYFQKIPFCSMEDVSKISMKSRLLDAAHIIRKNTYKLFLHIPYKEMVKQKVLYLDIIPRLLNRGLNKSWRLSLTDSFGAKLRQVLLSLRSNIGKDNFVFIDPSKLNFKMKRLFENLTIDTIICDPNNLSRLMDILDEKSKRKVKEVKLIRLFRDQLQENQAKNSLNNAIFLFQPPLIGISRVVRVCLFAQKQFGFNAVHPGKHTIIELINIDKSRFGEIIVTNTMPLQLSWIRYKTGIFGKAIFEKCQCGRKWIIILRRVKKFSFSLASVPAIKI